jgi:Tol biopolymer transport system component
MISLAGCVLSLSFLSLATVGAAAAQGPQDPPAASAEALARLEARLGGRLEARWVGGGLEARARAPAAGGAGADGPSEGDLQATRAAVEEFYGLPAGALVVLRQVKLAGLVSIQLEQRFEGLPVLDSRVELRFLGAELTLVRAAGLSGSGAEAGFAMQRADACEIARLAMPADHGSRLWAHAPRSAWLATTRGLRPVWQVEVWDPQSAATAWSVLVDGADGSLQRVQSGVLEGVSGTVDGRGMLAGPQTAGAPVVLPLANVYVTAADSAGLDLRLTDDACEQTEVELSADGSRAVWTSTCDGDGELWTSSADGSGASRLTDNDDEDHSPCVSGDGSIIVFVSDRDGDDELFAVGMDGNGLVQLTHNAVPDHSPTLSDDGARVVWVAGLGSAAELCTLLVAAPTPLQLTFDATLDERPCLSGDGTRIAWVAWADGDGEICAVDPDGSDFVQLTVNDAHDTDPSLVADGSRVVFASQLASDLYGAGDPSLGLPAAGARVYQRPQFDLFEGATDGSALARLTFSDADEREPDYAGAGGCVVYVSSDAGVADLEALELGTHQVLRLTDDAAPDASPRVGTTCASGLWLAHDGDGEVFAWDIGGSGGLLSAVTDGSGAYTLPVPDASTPDVQARLTGRFARVIDLDPSSPSEKDHASALAPAAGVDLHLNPTGFVEGPTAQVTAYAHVERAHGALDTVLRRAPLSFVGALPIDTQLATRANLPIAVANAFYSPARDEATFFMGAGPLRPNTAYDSVIYHEYGHYLDDMDGGIAGTSSCEAEFALSEGMGDALATFLTASPVVGADFFGAGTWIRNYAVFPWLAPKGSKGRQYGCEDCKMKGGKPEVHAHGEAFAGFAWDLRAALGAIAAEDLVFGAVFTNPPHMQAAVDAVFALAATPAFGGSGDPATSPSAAAICSAAARHGFDCPERADHGSWGCSPFTLCPSTPARHRVIGTEWLGVFIDAETACEPPLNFDDDGVVVPPHLGEGTLPPITVTMNVSPALKDSGRYGAPTPHPQLEARRVFLNGWLFIDNGAGGFDTHKVFGTGTPTGTLAYNPDTWSGASKSVGLTFTVPTVTEDRLGILRVRLDYGEDAGRLESCLSDPSLVGPCGTARFGEVEDYQVAVLNVVGP